jgi:hypothetical protein
MAFVPAPNIVMVEWRYTLFGQQCENRLHINHFGDPGPTELNSYAVNAWNWWELTYSPFIVDDCTLREVVATDIGVQNGEQVTYAPDTTTTGASIAFPLPNETSYCVSLRSASRGRSARGRWYVAGIPNNLLADANNLTSAAAENYRAALQTYINSVSAGAKAVVIVSYRTNNAPRPGGPVYFIVTSAVITDTVLDSQRRRKPGVGS